MNELSDMRVLEQLRTQKYPQVVDLTREEDAAMVRMVK